MKMNKHNEDLKLELKECISHCSGIFGEYRISGDDDYLLVMIEECAEGFYINADFELETWFSGEVIEKPSGFIVAFDEDFDWSLDEYLQNASQEITEGYLCPNNLLQFG